MLLALLLLFLLFNFYRKDPRCLFIHHSKQFSVSHEGKVIIYASLDTPKDTVQFLHQLVREASKENELFWGETLGKAIIIYCHNATQFYQYGEKGLHAGTRLGTYIIIPPTGLLRDYFSHELCHTELFNQVDRNWWTYSYRIPCWFQEGLALQFNNYGAYSPGSLTSIKIMSIKELRRLNSCSIFYRTSPEQLIERYAASKIEVQRWLNENSKEDILKVIEATKEGTNFYKAYGTLKVPKGRQPLE